MTQHKANKSRDSSRLGSTADERADMRLLGSGGCVPTLRLLLLRRAARRVLVVGAGGVRALQRGAASAGRGGRAVRRRARVRRLRGARAPRVARAHRRAAHRAHRRRRLPHREGVSAECAVRSDCVSCVVCDVRRVVCRSVMLWSLGGGCAWLPLALCAGGEGRAAPAGCALVYAATLLATPLHTALLCGRAALPALAGVLVTLSTAAAPFAAGAWLPLPSASPAEVGQGALGAQLAALALLYCECCERLCDAEAILYLSDVLVAFALEACCVLVSAAWCVLYARTGVLSRGEARLVALCALPRSLDTRWSMSCAARGMCRLPGVFVAPTQALLLAALAPDNLAGDDVLPLL